MQTVLPAELKRGMMLLRDGVETAPPIRGGSDSTWREAKLETGLEIMVPLFIAKGERIRVDTHERKYAGKAN